jgi:hypothetical protein
MKKTIILSLVLLLTTILNYSSATTTPKTLAKVEPSPITTLIIDANVTVVLVDNYRANLEVTGLSSLRDIVTFKEMGDTLVIGTTKNRNVRQAGAIYVPASQLKNIRINSEARVISLYTLQVPKLDVVINGACTVDIASIGEVNMTGTPLYTVDQTRDVHRISPSSVQKLNTYF